MKILITGAHGQLGHELLKILKSGVYDLGKMPEEYTDCEIYAVDIEDLDITDKNAVMEYITENQPNLVINCAAMTDVDGCETNEDAAFRINAEGPKNLAEACASSGCRLIHVSTDYVFSGVGKVPFSEADMPAPSTAYGRSKLQGEKYVLEKCKDSCVCRTAWLYGFEGNNFVKTMIRLGKEGKSIKVVDDQVGNPTSAVDLAYQLLLLGISAETGIFHCTCNGEPVSWYTFAKDIFSLAGLEVDLTACTTQEFPRPAKRPEYSALDNVRLRDTIGDSMRDWKISLSSFLEEFHG